MLPKTGHKHKSFSFAKPVKISPDFFEDLDWAILRTSFFAPTRVPRDTLRFIAGSYT